jgi:hypoxanthine phosphoribosyltransferase
MISKSIDSQLYEVYSAEEINAHLFDLAKKIIASKMTYDRVVALARGGVSIAQSLSDLIGVKRISVIQSEMYSGVYETKSPIIVQPLAANIKGEQILLIDDLADSGETLLFAKQYLAAHGPASVQTATLASKPWTKITPDFYELKSEAWIIFPWEVRETIQTVSKIWAGKGLSETKIRENLVSLGYSKDQIETFYRS